MISYRNSNFLVSLNDIFRGRRYRLSCSQHAPTIPFPAQTVFLHFSDLLFAALTAILLGPANGWAWEVNTHEELTEKAIEVVESRVNTYLVDHLGLDGGLDESLPGGTPRELMKQGSNKEDNGIRFINHFHEPVSNRGAKLPTAISAVSWSLSPVGEQEWSWNDAREYYYKALTSPSKTERRQNWAKMFLSLGHVMHLLQDSSNPSHVRDDLHPSLFGIGDVDGLHDYMVRRRVGAYLGGGIFSPDASILEAAGSAGPNGEPFANLFDRDVYLGSAPESTLSTNIGVTEYTSANFFSDDTIPGQGSIFSVVIPYPAVAELVPAPTPSPYLTLPRLGIPDFPGARAAKLTGNQAVARFVIANTNLDLLGQLQLDDAVYEAQAQHLIPRAVGYSAEVLNYFFRGTIPVVSGHYCFQPGNETNPPAYSISLDIKITVPDQFQNGGIFSAYFDHPDGHREKMTTTFVWDTSYLGWTRSFGTFYIGDDLGHPGPISVVVIYDGPLGPLEAEEPRGVVSMTYDITKFATPCLV